MEILHVLRHDHALGVVPRALADAVTRVDAGDAPWFCRAQIGMPVGFSRPCCLGEGLTMCIGASKPTEVRALVLTHAGDEERHCGLLRLRGSGKAETRKSDDGQHGKPDCRRHNMISFSSGSSSRVAREQLRCRPFAWLFSKQAWAGACLRRNLSR